MVFQLGILIALFGGLLGIALLRDFIRRRWPKVNDRHLDIALVVILLIGIAMAEIDHHNSEKERWKAQHQIRTLALELSVNFSVKWKGGDRVPDQRKWVVWGGTRVCTAEFVLRNGKTATVEFHGAENEKFTPAESNTTNLSYFSSALPGADIYALQPGEIESVRQFGFSCTFAPDALEDQSITFHRASAVFFVNGERSFSVEKTGEMTTNYGNEGGEACWWVISDFGKVRQIKR
jgi:hypothetical protein